MSFNQKMNKTTGIGFDPLFDNASMGIIVANDSGHIVITNPFLEKQFGYGPQELSGKPIEDLIPSRFTDRHQHHVEGYIKQPRSRPMGLGLDLFGRRKDGTEFPVEVSLSSYQTDQGKFVIGFISDISARKKAELELKDLNEQLEAKVLSRTRSLTSTVKQLAELITETELKDAELNRANTFLRSIWGHAEVILYVTDSGGTIKMFNPAAERELGYVAEEIIDKLSPSVFHSAQTLKQSADELTKSIQLTVAADFEALKIKTDLGLVNEWEIEYLRKDGSRFPASLTITAMHTATGDIEGYLGIAMNISKRKKAEEEILQSLKKEREMSEFKSRFVSMASHEFRTPLSTILSSAYLISKYTTENQQQRRESHVNRIASMVQSLTDILNDFLSLEKIEENKAEPHYSNFELADYIKNVITEIETLKKKGHLIRVSHQGETCVYLDQVMLKHIIINLLSNAIKFSPEDSHIDICSSVDQNQITIKISDKGLGIPERDMHHLFERFFRGSNANNIQGTGLGLHIVSRYVDLMGGKISCKSELGSGTEFTIEFVKTNQTEL
ncbi:PAS domain S-box protein [Pedobacter sp. G11]|nr:PAS domain S-box protein [Pedobacter sp. G11]